MGVPRNISPRELAEAHKPSRNLDRAQPQATVVSHMRRQPAAPAVYRPRPGPMTVQPKIVGPWQGRKQPIAPPVYRPQPVSEALQPKSIPGQPIHKTKTRHQPVAPPIYRPQLNRIAQPRMPKAPTPRIPTLPLAYRPHPRPAVLQTKSSRPGIFPASESPHPESYRQLHPAQGLIQRTVTANLRSSKNPTIHTRGGFLGRPCIQRKEILNLASGTNINRLMTGVKGVDNVINLDRGDMVDTQFILKNYDKFADEIEQAVHNKVDFQSRASSRLKGVHTAQQLAEQVKKEKLNFWFYKTLDGDIDSLERIIKSKEGLKVALAKDKAALLKADKGFMFGSVSPRMRFSDQRFDEIHMVSGYGIELLKSQELTAEMARLLKPGGYLIVTGNVPVLKSIGITITDSYDGGKATLPVHVEQHYFDAADWNWKVDAHTLGSEHTLGGEFAPDEQFHTLYFKKK